MKRLLSVIAVLSVSSVLTANVALAQAGAVRVTAERTSVRDRAATDGTVVATVAQGDQLQIVEVAGSWFKVRTSAGREGFVYGLFVERVGGAAASSAGTAAPAVASPPPTASAPSSASKPAPAATQAVGTQGSQPRFPGNGSEPLGNRRLGVGLANIGPSMRYWMDSSKGFQVDGYFRNSFGYSVAAISPSFVARFKEPKQTDSVMISPYLGAGITYYRFGSGYHDYYCGLYDSCSSSSLGFGGFGGAEFVINSVPKLGLSGQAGFYSGVYGFGGIGVGIGAHYYFSGR